LGETYPLLRPADGCGTSIICPNCIRLEPPIEQAWIKNTYHLPPPYKYKNLKLKANMENAPEFWDGYQVLVGWIPKKADEGKSDNDLDEHFDFDEEEEEEEEEEEKEEEDNNCKEK
jgi:hypothetical protein